MNLFEILITLRKKTESEREHLMEEMGVAEPFRSHIHACYDEKGHLIDGFGVQMEVDGHKPTRDDETGH